MLCAAGYACVVVTNQSVIVRAVLTEDGSERTHAEMRRQLAKQDARLDAVYHCSVIPTADSHTLVEHPDRKPGPGCCYAERKISAWT